MDDKDIFLLGTARETSTRLEDKMRRPFGDTTLMNLYMEKFREVMGLRWCDNAGMAIPMTDTWLRAAAVDLPLIDERPREDPNPQPRNEELYYLKDVKEPYVLWLNGCLPFLKTETVQNAVEWFKKDPDTKALTAVQPRHNWFWDAHYWSPINNIDWQCCSTQGCRTLLESTHAFHIFDRKLMLEHGAYWGFGKRNPYLFEMHDEIECIDIHTEPDFIAAEAVYKAIQEGRLKR